MREMEHKVHAKGPGGKCANVTDLFPEGGRTAKLRLEDAEAARIAYSSDEFRSRKIRSHGGDHDRSVNPK
jgi:hypothetical protein